MSLRDDINIPVVIVLGITTGLIVAVAIIGTRAGYNYVAGVDLARNYQEAERRGILHVGQNLMTQQRQSITTQPVEWSDTNKTAVRLPLEQAIQVMVNSKGNPPAK